MKNRSNQNCPLCKINAHEILFSYSTPDKYETVVGVSKKNYFRKWIRCKQCGLCYSAHSRPAKLLDKIYISTYRDKNTLWRDVSPEETFRKISALPAKKSETEFRVNWIKENINEIWRGGLLKKPTPPFKAFDIGGGGGVFAHKFKDKKWRTYVIDPSKNNSFIRTKLRIPLIQGFYRPGLFRHKFELVSLIYVLEHIADPLKFLSNIRKDMTKKSFLYIEIPDSIAFRLKPKNDDIFNSCHLWMFNPQTLSSLLDKCGFEIFRLSRTKTIRGHYCLMALVGLK